MIIFVEYGTVQGPDSYFYLECSIKTGRYRRRVDTGTSGKLDPDKIDLDLQR
jgi:hypothetical protein